MTASQCHVLFVLGQTERTCPPLLKEATPHCCWVYEWKIISHLYWFLISCLVLFAQENEKDVLLLYSNARKKSVSPEASEMFLGSCPSRVVSLSSICFPPALLLSLPCEARLHADGLISCNGRLCGDSSAEEASQPPKIK